MDWNRKEHPLERLAAALAASALGLAIGYALFALVPLAGAALVGAATAGGLAGTVAGLMLLNRIGGAHDEGGGFEPAEFTEFEADDAFDELLLDDPIAPPHRGSRVVQLFEPSQPEPLPEPGELVARIADYLGSGRSVQPAQPEAVRQDASAALHAALADIRRSLR